MNLTKKEAIELHRKMWNWIADETEKRKEIVTKVMYFEEHPKLVRPRSKCFCCEYAFNTSNCRSCDSCPIIWKDVDDDKISCCMAINSVFLCWYDSDNYKEAADLARRIANLSKKED